MLTWEVRKVVSVTAGPWGPGNEQEFWLKGGEVALGGRDCAGRDPEVGTHMQMYLHGGYVHRYTCVGFTHRHTCMGFTCTDTPTQALSGRGSSSVLVRRMERTPGQRRER